MRLHRRDGKPTDNQSFRLFLISLLPVTVPVGAWFVPES